MSKMAKVPLVLPLLNLEKRIPQNFINIVDFNIEKMAYLSYCIQYSVTLIKIIILITVITIMIIIFFVFFFIFNFFVLLVYSKEECQPMHGSFISLFKSKVTVKFERFNLAF